MTTGLGPFAIRLGPGSGEWMIGLSGEKVPHHDAEWNFGTEMECGSVNE